MNPTGCFLPLIVVVTICLSYSNGDEEKLTSRTKSKYFAPPKTVRCHGPVVQKTSGKYYFHENSTDHELKVTTNLNVKLDLWHISCFQVDVEVPDNETDSVNSIFYVFEYANYLQHYSILKSYKFGIPEFQSYCRCDCPKADSFCTYESDLKPCSKGDVCVKKFFPDQNGYGCQYEGPSSLCCEISVRPYENRRFTAAVFDIPLSEAVLKIEIFVRYAEQWNQFRKYIRKILPSKGNKLHLNGHENVANLFIRGHSGQAAFKLSSSDKSYYYEDRTKFRLLEQPMLTNKMGYQAHYYDFLRFVDDEWVVNPISLLHTAHKPIVTNCKYQRYTDTYDLNIPVKVIRNSTGAINQHPVSSHDITQTRKAYVASAWLTHANDHAMVTLSHTSNSAPTLELNIRLHQKMSIISHLHVSHFKEFVAMVCLDRYRSRYLNTTLVQAFGQFMIEVFKDGAGDQIDLVFQTKTSLPFASNHSEVLPLPGRISNTRYVCVYPDNKPARRICKWAKYKKEPVLEFVLKNHYIETEGNCPGCNVDTENDFWSNLNPRKWLNGIGSISEGFALAIEISFYILIAIISFALIRKCIWPLLKWTFITKKEPRYKKSIDQVSI